MSLGIIQLSMLAIATLVSACRTNGGSAKVDPDEPQTAKEKQLLEAKAKDEVDDGNAGKWGKWRYEGDRDDCFYVVGRKCFKTENAACQSLRCKLPKRCDTTGAGPATLSCK